MTDYTPEALEALIVELRCGDPSGAKCDKASDMLLAICHDLRTGQLILAQPSGFASHRMTGTQLTTMP